MNEVTKNLKDAAYVLIGLGVIGYQRAQAQSDELRGQLDKQVVETRAQLTKLAKDAQLSKLAKNIESRIEPVVTQAREAAVQAQTTLRTRLNRAA
ncbi:MAG TPA: hypothetical protein VFB78_06130 [Acidimicrobiales bacterium]|nr:hypothetical protein [Acidimicrobiales bacterium]